MFYRLVSITIVVFWLVMNTLLIRNEVDPAGSRVRELPVAHVLKQLFIHQQRSNLRIYSGITPLGYLSIYPHLEEKENPDLRVLDFSGTLQFELGAGRRQRISWDTVLRMNASFDLIDSEYHIKLHEPGDLLADIRTSADRPLVHVRLSSRNVVIEDRDIALNQSSLENLAQQFGANADVIGMIHQPAQRTQPVIRARRSSVRLPGDQRTETYLITVEHNGQTYLECHFSEVGIALQANTIFGYTLEDESLR